MGEDDSGYPRACSFTLTVPKAIERGVCMVRADDAICIASRADCDCDCDCDCDVRFISEGTSGKVPLKIYSQTGEVLADRNEELDCGDKVVVDLDFGGSNAGGGGNGGNN